MALGRPQLVLDIGGVLLSDLTPPFWHWVAMQAAAPYDEVLARFRHDVREAVWTGVMTDGQFWGWLCTAFPPINDSIARAPGRDSEAVARFGPTRDLGAIRRHPPAEQSPHGMGYACPQRPAEACDERHYLKCSRLLQTPSRYLRGGGIQIAARRGDRVCG